MPGLLEEVKKKLAGIKESAPPEKASSSAGKQDEVAFKEQLERDKLAAEVRGIQQDISERKKYAHRTFWLICFWLAGVFLLLLLDGFLGANATSLHFKDGNTLDLKFSLGDNVLMAVVGGTTASVISIFVIVVKYLFSKH